MGIYFSGDNLSWIKYFVKPVGWGKYFHGAWLLRVDGCFLTDH